MRSRFRARTQPSAPFGAQPLAPFASSSFFTKIVNGLTPVTVTPTEANPTGRSPYALKMANQLNYGNTGYDYLGKNEGPHFYGYSGVGLGGSTDRQPVVNFAQYTSGIFVIPPGHPVQKVTVLNGNEEAGDPAYKALQEELEEVPVPLLSAVPAGRLWPAIGSDRFMILYQPSTDTYWDFWHMGGTENAYTCNYAGKHTGASAWNGLFGGLKGATATSLALQGGMITLQDIIEVQEGKPITHAIYVAVFAEKIGTPVAPATRTDGPNNKTVEGEWTVHKEIEGVPNPAYRQDAVIESQYFRFPPGSKASEYGLTKPLQIACFNAIRDYGLFVGNGGESLNFVVEWPGTLGSPYAWNRNINPFRGAPMSWNDLDGGFPWIPESLPGPAVPMTDNPYGGLNFMTVQPWQLLELLPARTS